MKSNTLDNIKLFTTENYIFATSKKHGDFYLDDINEHANIPRNHDFLSYENYIPKIAELQRLVFAIEIWENISDQEKDRMAKDIVDPSSLLCNIMNDCEKGSTDWFLYVLIARRANLYGKGDILRQEIF